MTIDTHRRAIGHVHRAAFYASDAEFRDLIVPFVQDAVDAGHPVVMGYDERKSEMLRSWLGVPPGVTYASDTSLYATPARAIESYRKLFEHHVARGADQIRIAGDVPHAGNGGRFEGWDRYESAVNTVWDEFPVRSLCLYDATTVTDDVRDVVERTHPQLLDPTGELRDNGRYEPPSCFTGLPMTPDPLEARDPDIELGDVLPGEARRALERIGVGRIDPTTLDQLSLGLSEVATNALIHGQAPTVVRMWAAPGRLVVHVSDSGPGPADRHVGLIRSVSEHGAGVGLWLTHQLDIDVAMMATAQGFTVRLRAGLPA
jgi:anti-sigma regulatory factor (Ser/Thr protein kinase)